MGLEVTVDVIQCARQCDCVCVRAMMIYVRARMCENYEYTHGKFFLSLCVCMCVRVCVHARTSMIRECMCLCVFVVLHACVRVCL